MTNYFRRSLCSLLTVGFIFGGCSSLNKYETDLPQKEKPAQVKTSTQLMQTSSESMLKLPIGIDKSNFYLIKNSYFDGRISADYQILSLPKTDYLSIGRGQKVTKEHLKEQLLRSLGLEDTILSGKFKLYGTKADLHINLSLDPLSGNQNVGAIVIFRF